MRREAALLATLLLAVIGWELGGLDLTVAQTFATPAGFPARVQTSASAAPTISPNIWWISGAVVKSPPAPSGSRVA